MNKIIIVIEDLLRAYERSTSSIDQELVDRVQKCLKIVRHYAAAGFIALMVVLPARAYNTNDNPDRYLSVGLDVSTGKLAGIQKDTLAGAPHTDGGFTKGVLDIRVPISNMVTLHTFGSSTGINNNLQFSEGNEVGMGLRVYLH